MKSECVSVGERILVVPREEGLWEEEESGGLGRVWVVGRWMETEGL